MSKQVTISNINGTEPYNIYICDNLYSVCIWVSQINNASLPYSFIVPKQFESFTTVGIKVIDNDKCEIKSLVSL